MIDELKAMGMKNVALISGGDTTLIASAMIQTGTSLLLADYNSDHLKYKELCRRHDVAIRASIESKVVQEGDDHEMLAASKVVIDHCKDYYKFIFGCGIVSYDTPPEHVLKLKSIVNQR
jgi:uroporphyrinogen decarboxylase